MPRQQIGAGMQPLPSLPDPMQSLSSMMGLARSMQGYEDDSKARGDRDALNAALQASGGDYTMAAAKLRTEGRATIAADLDTKAKAQKQADQGALWETQDRAAKGFETATRYMQAVEDASPETRGERWSQIRPQLLQALPEGFHKHIPEQYDPKFTSEAIPFGMSVAEAAHRRSEAVRTLNEKSATAKNALDQDNAVLEALVPWMQDIDNYQELEQVVQQAERTYGASPAVRARIGDVPTGPFDAKTKQAILNRLKPGSMPQTIQAALLKAHEAGDQASVKSLIRLQASVAAAQDGARSQATPEAIAAVAGNPAMWNDLPPSLRADLLPALARRGFDFGAAAKVLPASQRRQIEQWKTDQITDLEKQFREGDIAESILEREKARIQESYRTQMGEGQAAPAPGTGRAAAARDAVLPPERRRGQAPPPGAPAAARATTTATGDVTKALTAAGKAFTLDPGTQQPIVVDGQGRRIRVTKIEGGKIHGVVVD